jgi:C_GCAxxG_C_C family probable redox protein
MKKTDFATSLFKKGFNCAQTVLVTFCEQFGLDRADAVKISCGFGGGMGRMALVCGAVAGSYMVLGLRYGPAGEDMKSSKEETYSMVREFADRFNKRHGSIICREILGYDISTESGLRKAGEEGLFESVCGECVRDAVQILEELI